jgi:hypothetical protein
MDLWSIQPLTEMSTRNAFGHISTLNSCYITSNLILPVVSILTMPGNATRLEVARARQARSEFLSGGLLLAPQQTRPASGWTRMLCSSRTTFFRHPSFYRRPTVPVHRLQRWHPNALNVCPCVLHDSRNKQRLFPETAFTVWSL